jgi:uncharacterized membrane protein
MSKKGNTTGALIGILIFLMMLSFLFPVIKGALENITGLNATESSIVTAILYFVLIGSLFAVAKKMGLLS